ncbi:MAG: P1 family peptidase [Anaerolineales bacterium]
MTRARARDLGIVIGRLPPGRWNAITDVPDLWVGHTTVIRDDPRVVRTGVTMIVPRGGRVWSEQVFAGFHSFNGAGEMTGIHWVEESGLLSSPIALTNTHQVGLVRDTLVGIAQQRRFTEFSSLPVVGETYDGRLSDMDAFSLTEEHVRAALDNAGPGPVEEGNVGGGTGMICHDFKGGIGTASRVVEVSGLKFTVGALVQANHGSREDLRVDGVPVGRHLGVNVIPSAWEGAEVGGSLLAILATDAPLLPGQCRRLARRATVGMSRCGGIGHNASGDLFLALSTSNWAPAESRGVIPVSMLAHPDLDVLFSAAAEAVEEAILNCLTAAETMVGFRGRTAYAIPLDELSRILQLYRPA